MGVLETHQDRVEALRKGLDRLLELHQRAHDLGNQTIAAAKSGEPGKEQAVLALRAKLQAVSREIATLRASLEPLAAPPAKPEAPVPKP
jgi:uncharacterized membrane protein YccC